MENIIKEPSDGWTQYERAIMRESIVSIYKIIDDPLDKFILCVTFEGGYTQDEAGRMLGISQVAVQKRLKKTLTYVRGMKCKLS